MEKMFEANKKDMALLQHITCQKTHHQDWLPHLCNNLWKWLLPLSLYKV